MRTVVCLFVFYLFSTKMLKRDVSYLQALRGAALGLKRAQRRRRAVRRFFSNVLGINALAASQNSDCVFCFFKWWMKTSCWGFCSKLKPPCSIRGLCVYTNNHVLTSCLDSIILKKQSLKGCSGCSSGFMKTLRQQRVPASLTNTLPAAFRPVQICWDCLADWCTEWACIDTHTLMVWIFNSEQITIIPIFTSHLKVAIDVIRDLNFQFKVERGSCDGSALTGTRLLPAADDHGYTAANWTSSGMWLFLKCVFTKLVPKIKHNLSIRVILKNNCITCNAVISHYKCGRK